MKHLVTFCSSGNIYAAIVFHDAQNSRYRVKMSHIDVDSWNVFEMLVEAENAAMAWANKL